MKTSEFDKAFEAGRDVSHALEMEQADRPNLQTRRVNVDFPAWMVQELDREAARLGVNRQAIIKTWISRLLDDRSAA